MSTSWLGAAEVRDGVSAAAGDLRPCIHVSALIHPGRRRRTGKITAAGGIDLRLRGERGAGWDR